MIIKEDEICGYWVDEKLLCEKCFDALEEKPELDADMVLTRDEVEKGDKLYFCDNCKEQIVG